MHLLLDLLRALLPAFLKKYTEGTEVRQIYEGISFCSGKKAP
jgi:hypothetical protein